MSAYYNEIDPYAAQWLRNLIARGLIAAGDVDDRSIVDVKADDLAGYRQCHFFAGIGGWSYALRLAGWPDDREVWTGSCPCQPFSVAGKRTGTADERHLWPVWRELVRERKPAVVFGEQVEAAIRHNWLDLVQSDLEGIGYAFAAAGSPAASVGAPHIRQRLWFVADADGRQCGWLSNGEGCERYGASAGRVEGDGLSQRGGAAFGLADNDNEGQFQRESDGAQDQPGQPASLRRDTAGCGANRVMGDPRGAGLEGFSGHGDKCAGPVPPGSTAEAGEPCGTGPADGFWRDADWIFCRDGKWRPVEPGSFPLAHGIPGRVGRLRAYGNAIVPQVAAEVIGAFMECRP